MPEPHTKTRIQTAGGPEDHHEVKASEQVQRQSTTDMHGEIMDDDEFNEMESDPNQMSFPKWLSQYGLEHFYDTFLQLGFDNVYVVLYPCTEPIST